MGVCSKGALLGSAGRGIASLLAQKCTRLRRMVISGGTGPEALEVFGANCSNIFSLEVAFKDISGQKLDTILQTARLPGLTHVSMSDVEPTHSREDWPHRLCTFLAICKSRTVVYISAARGLLLHSEEWSHLPFQLQQLRCEALPPTALPVGMILPNLWSLTMSASAPAINSTQLLSLLTAAPMLQLLAMTGGAEGNEVISETQWSVTDISALQLLSQRVAAGLVLHDVNLILQSNPAQVDVVVGVKKVFRTMQPLPCDIDWLVMKNHEGAEPDVGPDSLALAEVARLFPRAIRMAWTGWWQARDVDVLRCGPHVWQIVWSHFHQTPTMAALLQMLVRHPAIQALMVEDWRGQQAPTTEMREAMAAARVDAGLQASAVLWNVTYEISLEDASWWEMRIWRE